MTVPRDIGETPLVLWNTDDAAVLRNAAALRNAGDAAVDAAELWDAGDAAELWDAGDAAVLCDAAPRSATVLWDGAEACP
jgi:hypothetical protein